MARSPEFSRGTNQFSEVNGLIIRRPDRHTKRSEIMGSGVVSWATNTTSLESVTPNEIAGMSAKEKARLKGEVKRLQKEKLGGLPDKSPIMSELAETTLIEANEVEIDSVDSTGLPLIFSFGEIKSRIDDAARSAEFEVDALSLCNEQSRRVAGDKVILGDDLVHRVISTGEENYSGFISLDLLREEAELAEAQELFDYGTTAKDLREN